MSTETSARKRLKPNPSETIVHTDSIDASSDLTFLVGSINSKDIFLRLLLSGQIANLSFSDLYRKSQSIGWKQVLVELRTHLKLDEKSKLKRFVFNRLIDEYSTNGKNFDAQVQKLNEDMKKQLSNSMAFESARLIHLRTINDVYDEINRWRELQCHRRLFDKDYNQRCSFLILQQYVTDHLINLIRSPHLNSSELERLFSHCLVIVVQPSGTDGLAVTKYERVGEACLVKIKTRIICLLDPDRIGKYLELSELGVTLHLKDRSIDPQGDVQSPLPWKTRTIKYDGDRERTFWYVELAEHEPIKLTKKNSNGKLVYNKRLCRLEFQMKFKLIGTNFETLLQFNSQYFGVCSHSKYAPKFLTKVFLHEMERTAKADSDIHPNVLEPYIYDVHEYISGVYPKLHTQEFIHDALMNVYRTFHQSAVSCDGPVMFFSIDIYENTLEKLFSQMKFMGKHPFLSIMYLDHLFLGICSDEVDGQLNGYTLGRSQLIMRFALPAEQEKPDNPDIICAVYNDILLKSRITHDYLVSDMSTCICLAGQNEETQILVRDHEIVSLFSLFERYYDQDLSRDNLIQTKNERTYFPLNAILRNTMSTHPVQSQPLHGQHTTTYTFDLSGILKSDEDITPEIIAFLQEQYASICKRKNVQGSLTAYSLGNLGIIDSDLTDLLCVRDAS